MNPPSQHTLTMTDAPLGSPTLNARKKTSIAKNSNISFLSNSRERSEQTGLGVKIRFFLKNSPRKKSFKKIRKLPHYSSFSTEFSKWWKRSSKKPFNYPLLGSPFEFHVRRRMMILLLHFLWRKWKKKAAHLGEIQDH